jgi:hypothetical protein
MNMKGGLRLSFCILLGSLLSLISLGGAAVHAAEVNLKAQLIWGTDGDKPPAASYKEVEGAIKKKLCRVFKWKNYFEISQQPAAITSTASKRLKMSPRCEVEVRFVDDTTLEIKLFGEGKLTKTVRQPLKSLTQGGIAVIAGDAKDNVDDAWFVVFSVPQA